MHTRIGTIALGYLAETGSTTVGYADTEAQAIIAERAGWSGRPAERIRLELLAALDRDERFAKDFAHVAINGQTRKVRVYHRAGTSLLAPPTLAVSLPLDPWRRRLFLGALLDIDPHAITDAHAVATLAVLPAALSRLPHTQRERIIKIFGLNHQPATSYTDQALSEQRGRLTIRSSIRSGMETLKAIVRTEVLATIDSATPPASLPGDPLFWERVDRSGTCWLWTGTRDRGYAVFKRHGKKHMATRYVYELYYGPVPDGHHITHTCEGDTTLCVRPEHLIAALPSEIGGSPLRSRR
jgi:HNH endonuclease